MRSGEVPVGGRGSFPPNSSDHQAPRLTKSRTSLELNNNNNSNRVANKAQQVAPSTATVATITNQHQPVSNETASPAGQFALQRSKSSGSHLSLQQQKVPVPTPTVKANNPELPDVSSFPDAAQILLRKIAVGMI